MNPVLTKLIAGQIFIHACMAGTRLAAPLLALRQGYSETSVGVLLALFALASMVLALPAGRYIDRNHIQKPIAISVGVATVGLAFSIVWPHFWALCISAVCAGGATGVTVIALQRYVGRSALDSLELKKTFAWLSVGPAISNFLGPLIAGFLIDYAGFKAAFIFLSVLPLLGWFWMRNTPALPGSTAPSYTSTSAWTLLKLPHMRRLLWVNWFVSSCWDVHTFVVPVISHARDYSASTVGGILGAFALSATLVRLLLPILAKHLQEWAVIATAMLMTALLFGIYPLMPSAFSMGLCSVCLGLTLGCVQPMIMSTLHHITPKDRQGEAIGLRLMTINASSVVMPIVFGGLTALVGVSAIFWGVGLVVGVGARLAVGLNKPYR